MTLTGHNERVVDVAFSPDGARVASTSTDRAARLWDATTGETLAILTGHHQPLNRVAFSPDSTRVVTTSGDATIRIWETATGNHVHTLFADAPAWAVSYSPDGTRIATGTDDSKVTLWDADSGRRLLTLTGHATDLTSVAFLPDGERLLTGALDDTTRLWDISVAGSRDWLTLPGPVESTATVAFHPDGTSIAVAGDTSGVAIYGVQTGEILATLGGLGATIHRLAFSPDGRLLAGASAPGDPPAKTLPVWDTDSGDLLFELSADHSAVVDLAYTPDGRHLAVIEEDGTLRLWNATNGDERWAIQRWEEAYSVAVSPDGRFVAASGARHPPDVSYEVEQAVLTVDAGEVVATLVGHEDWTPGLAFGPDGGVVTASIDGTVRVWDAVTGELQTTLQHDTGVTDVAVSPDGTRLATAAQDGTSRLWDLDSGRQVLTLHAHDAPVRGVTFSPDGRLLATSSFDGTVALHLLPIDELVELARSRLTRGLTDDECRQFLHAELCPQS